MAADGAAAYRAQLAADVRARQAAGAILLHNHHIQVVGAAGAELAGGRVDARLLVTLAALAALHPLDIVSFGGAGPGASAGVPLRSAEITVAAPRRRRSPGVTARSACLLPRPAAALPAPVRGNGTVTPGRTVLQIGYRVPCPLGLLRTRS